MSKMSHKNIASGIAAIVMFFLAFGMAPVDQARAEWRGGVDLEYRYFYEDALDARQPSTNFSASIEPEYLYDWNDGRDLLNFKTFFRVDEHDDERSHADLRELLWTHAADRWEFKAGVGKVFWGVTESSHLVDVINQTDLVENSDGEDKLGQPMLNLTLIRDYGNFDIFLLPGFRERSFAGASGRPRGSLIVDSDLVEYESAAEDKRLDAALRWSHTVGLFDIGLSHFRGTRREPRFEVRQTGDQGPVLAPIYDVVDQTGLDAQATLDNILLKAEVVRQSGLRDEINPRWWATTFGFEYTFYGIFDSSADLGVLVEYLHDSRGASVPFENDVLVGARIAFNDVQGTELLIGSILDTDGNGRSFNLESSRRFGDHWRLYVEARAISDVDDSHPLASLRQDDYLQLSLGYFF